MAASGAFVTAEAFHFQNAGNKQTISKGWIIFADNNQIGKADLLDFLHTRNRSILERQRALANAMGRLDATPIDPDLDYMTITAMRREARDKLGRVRPETLGQASRISGVNPPDIALLSIHLKRRRVSRETIP